jgi:hypothetical protein
LTFKRFQKEIYLHNEAPDSAHTHNNLEFFHLGCKACWVGASKKVEHSSASGVWCVFNLQRARAEHRGSTFSEMNAVLNSLLRFIHKSFERRVKIFRMLPLPPMCAAPLSLYTLFGLHFSLSFALEQRTKSYIGSSFLQGAPTFTGLLS